MNCSELVARFTDYLDGVASEADLCAIERHLEICPKCVRYKSVLQHGADLVRSLPEPEIGENFTPRLQHRLFHVDDERALVTQAASGAPALTVLGIALLLTAVAWSPTLFSGSPVLDLAPIVVDRAPERYPVRSAGLSLSRPFNSAPEEDLETGLWANTLIYDYSLLSRRYDQRIRGRRSTQSDR